MNLAWVRSKIAKKTGADRSKNGESPIGATSGPYPVPKRTSTGPWGLTRVFFLARKKFGAKVKNEQIPVGVGKNNRFWSEIRPFSFTMYFLEWLITSIVSLLHSSLGLWSTGDDHILTLIK